jgi:hypothetical protein
MNFITVSVICHATPLGQPLYLREMHIGGFSSDEGLALAIHGRHSCNVDVLNQPSDDEKPYGPGQVRRAGRRKASFCLDHGGCRASSPKTTFLSAPHLNFGR